MDTATRLECPGCLMQPGHPHQDWHVTREQALDIGREISRRAKARELWAISNMPDALLEARVADLKRQKAMSGEDGLPNFLVELVQESLTLAEKELHWRRKAVTLGAPALQRDARWRDRIETIRQEADLAMLIAYECQNAKPDGPGRWVCSCPFHGDPGPSLSINVAKRVWHCFGCQQGGDAFTYVMLRLGLDFQGAVAHLEARLGILPPDREPKVIRGVSVARVGSDT